MERIEQNLEKVAEAFDQKITYCGAPAYGAAGLWAVVRPDSEEDEGQSDIISMAALTGDLPKGHFLKLMGAFFWDYVKKEDLHIDSILQLVSDVLGAALTEHAAENVSEYRDSTSFQELAEQEDIQKQLESFSETAFEFKTALKRRCGDVKPLAAVSWNGTAGEVGTSALSAPSMSAEEWANTFRAFLLLPLMDGTLSEADVKSIFENAYHMLINDRDALPSE